MMRYRTCLCNLLASELLQFFAGHGGMGSRSMMDSTTFAGLLIKRPMIA